ncbi:hypothetical protein PR048_032226, partial [Dryococelus australis]
FIVFTLLQHSYGFIQCCERQARLFFHFSQFNGNIEHLKIGDPVEFEMTYDRRTGKPIASAVTKIAPEVVLSEERVTGTVTTELRAEGSGGDTQGRISYENRGECFFLPYNKDDVEGNVTLRSGDKVSFQIATNQRSGNLGACHIRLENPAHPVKYQGVICSMKESFGFIERADVVKEIFFHFSEAKSVKDELRLGDDVEFTIQTRNITGIACTPSTAPSCPQVGGSSPSNSLPLPFSASQKVPGTQQPVVVAIRREKVPVCLCWLRFSIHHYPSPDRVTTSSFSLSSSTWEPSSCLSCNAQPPQHRRCQRGVWRRHYVLLAWLAREYSGQRFCFVPCRWCSVLPEGKEVACNISRLDPGSVVFEDVCSEVVKGQVLKPLERSQQARQQHQSDPLPGRIRYRAPDHSEVEIPFGDKDQRGDFTLKHGDWVQFRIATDRRDQLQRATNISLLEESFNVSGERREQGAVVTLKEGFGFIHCAERESRLFFHFNEVLDVDRDICLNDEVEFTVIQEQTSFSNSRQSAIRIKHLTPGTVQFEVVVERGVTGVVSKEGQLPGGWSSRSPSKSNTQVEFNICQVKRSKELVAVDVKVTSKGSAKNGVSRASNLPLYQGFIAALKDGFGFIETIAHDREVFFHF